MGVLVLWCGIRFVVRYHVFWSLVAGLGPFHLRYYGMLAFFSRVVLHGAGCLMLGMALWCDGWAIDGASLHAAFVEKVLPAEAGRH